MVQREVEMGREKHGNGHAVHVVRGHRVRRLEDLSAVARAAKDTRETSVMYNSFDTKSVITQITFKKNQAALGHT